MFKLFSEDRQRKSDKEPQVTNVIGYRYITTILPRNLLTMQMKLWKTKWFTINMTNISPISQLKTHTRTISLIGLAQKVVRPQYG